MIDGEFSSVYSVFLPHCSDDDDEWEPVDDHELEHAEPLGYNPVIFPFAYET